MGYHLEFYQRAKLYMLQTRNGKRTAAAAEDRRRPGARA